MLICAIEILNIIIITIWIFRLSGLFLWSQFGHEYLLVTIKIRSHVNQKQRLRLSKLMAQSCFVASEISRSMACSAFIHDRHVFKEQAIRSFRKR